MPKGGIKRGHMGQAVGDVEHQLAHKVPDALGATYSRTRFLKERMGTT